MVGRYITLVLLLTPCVLSLPMQDIEDDGTTAEVVAERLEATTVPTSPGPPAPPEPRNCTTAREAPGRCVARASCDYGTQHIDFTPYAPKGYVKICAAAEVCCPLDSIVVTSPPPANNLQDDDGTFDFDEDD